MPSRPATRRDFLKHLSAAAPAAEPTAAKLPRWRGFNLLEKFIARNQNAPFRESDFAWMAEWGFNFARLPLSYHCWSDASDWRTLREPVLQEIDAAVAFGRRYGVHVCLNFHRAPGYSVDASAKEPFNLWTDAVALEACAYHWRHFARRYRDVPSSALSFDLVNEPAMKTPDVLLDDEGYLRVAQVLVETIRAESPQRLIFADGLSWGVIPVPALAKLGVAQSTRGYAPFELTHWKASWVAGSDQWPAPAWPQPTNPDKAASDVRQMERFRRTFKNNPIVQGFSDEAILHQEWNRQRLRVQTVRPWQQLEAMGVGVHVGEFGAYRSTPHDVTLRWMRDVLACWREAGWGWALWNFRGAFGVLDSGRSDVTYESFRGHKLDRAMLETLREG